MKEILIIYANILQYSNASCTFCIYPNVAIANPTMQYQRPKSTRRDIHNIINTVYKEVISSKTSFRCPVKE